MLLIETSFSFLFLSFELYILYFWCVRLLIIYCTLRLLYLYVYSIATLQRLSIFFLIVIIIIFLCIYKKQYQWMLLLFFNYPKVFYANIGGPVSLASGLLTRHMMGREQRKWHKGRSCPSKISKNLLSVVHNNNNILPMLF